MQRAGSGGGQRVGRPRRFRGSRLPALAATGQEHQQGHRYGSPVPGEAPNSRGPAHTPFHRDMSFRRAARRGAGSDSSR